VNGKGKQLAIWGVVLQLGTIVGLVGTIIGLIRAFGKVAQSGTARPEALASELGIALYTTAAGMILSLVGVVFILVALFAVRYRAPWFETALWVLSVLWLLCVPAGTVLGIVVILYLIKHRREFREPGGSSEAMT